MHYVYILRNQNGRYYIGSCEDLKKRVAEHNQNSVRSTKNRGPFELMHSERVGNRTEARKRENEIKRRKSKAYIEDLIRKHRDPIV